VKRPEFSSTLILILLALVWGSSFILMKMGLRATDGSPVMSPYQVACLRMIFAALALSPITIHAVKKIKKEDWKYLLVVGLCGSGIPAFLFAISQQFLDSGLAGILNAITPLFTLLFAVLFFKKETHKKQIFGMIIGFIGAAGIIAVKGSSLENYQYAFLIITATFLYGISVNTVGHHLQHVKAPWITAISITIASIPCLLIFATTNIAAITSHPEGFRSLSAIAILAIFGTGIANIIFFRLTQTAGAIMASTVTYLIPIVAVGWGFFLGESLSMGQLAFAGVILLGVYLGSQGKKN
jgi:drug/metabolite transporter (DMT)-like permease